MGTRNGFADSRFTLEVLVFILFLKFKRSWILFLERSAKFWQNHI